MLDQQGGHAAFSGSYAPADIHFLLKRVYIASTPINAKEAAIQSGARHYSEMISDEARPDQKYLDLFNIAWLSSRARIATEVLAIARQIRAQNPGQITLCSLVRAGAPLGVLLTRALRDMGADVANFGLSIIRDRGLDMNAMRHIMAQRDTAGIFFVDGWTGKGAITEELRKSWQASTGLHPRLVVLADPCGVADIAGSNEDWLIPNGILGANISGLISRSIRNADVIGPKDFDGYIPVDHLADIDLSSAFVDDIHQAMRDVDLAHLPDAVRRSMPIDANNKHRLTSTQSVLRVMRLFETSNANRVKPGIAEATRAVLRRKPHHVLLSREHDPDLSALIHLCREGGIAFSFRPELTGPYRAITIIERTR